MRAIAVGRDARFGRATVALAVISLGAAAVAVVLVWEVLVDPLAVAELLESIASRP
jgi:hypothetical protein